jgi:hypothetical protein
VERVEANCTDRDAGSPLRERARERERERARARAKWALSRVE